MCLFCRPRHFRKTLNKSVKIRRKHTYKWQKLNNATNIMYSPWKNNLTSQRKMLKYRYSRCSMDLYMYIILLLSCHCEICVVFPSTAGLIQNTRKDSFFILSNHYVTQTQLKKNLNENNHMWGWTCDSKKPTKVGGNDTSILSCHFVIYVFCFVSMGQLWKAVG